MYAIKEGFTWGRQAAMAAASASYVNVMILFFLRRSIS
jgi:hypothetical protein